MRWDLFDKTRKTVRVRLVIALGTILFSRLFLSKTTVAFPDIVTFVHKHAVFPTQRPFSAHTKDVGVPLAYGTQHARATLFKLRDFLIETLSLRALVVDVLVNFGKCYPLPYVHF